MITSRNNPRIKQFAALKLAKERRTTGTTLAEGTRLVREAFTSGVAVTTLILAKSFSDSASDETLEQVAVERKVEILHVTDSVFAKISQLNAPEGVAALVPLPTADQEKLYTADARLLVAAGVQDPGNAGALLRVAEAAGASGCVFVGGVDPGHPRLLRASAGSAFRLPCAVENGKRFIEHATAAKIRLLLADVAGNAVAYTGADYTPPLAICLGAEGVGIPSEFFIPEVEIVTIPMHGRVESLNVSVAAGILLYQASHTWHSGHTGM